MSIITPQKTKSYSKACALCNLAINKFVISFEDQDFCCNGCQTVYQILKAKNQLDQKHDHPLIKQAAQYGIISNAEIIASLGNKKSKNIIKKIFEVSGLWCTSCADLIAYVLKQQKGILSIHVDYTTDLASIQFDPFFISLEQVKDLVNSLGYEFHDIQDTFERPIHYHLKLRFIIACFCALNVMMFTYPLYTTFFSEDQGMKPLLAYLSLALVLPVIGYSATPIFRRCVNQITNGLLGMETLVTLGILASFILSCYEILKGTYHIYFDTIAVLVSFVLLGKIIESKGKFSSKEALYKLHGSLPKKGRKKNGDTFSFVPLKEVKKGDVLMAYTGEKIVLDGKLLEGEGYCNESLVTGESKPIYKSKGSLLIAGSIVQQGIFQFEVISTSENSTLQKIISLLEPSLQKKAEYSEILEDILKIFIPSLILFSFFIFVFLTLTHNITEATLRAMSILLIACPCAIGIAAPLVESILISRFSEKGAIIRNRHILKKLPKVSHFIFDKTGTITEGKFSLSENFSSEFYKPYLKGLVSKSIHPVSKAIDQFLDSTSVLYTLIQEIPGKGIQGCIHDQWFYLGSSRWAKEKNHTVSKNVIFFTDQEVLWEVDIKDHIKPDAKCTLQNIHAKKILLSGDAYRIVSDIAHQLSFDDFKAEVHPLEKQQFVEQLKLNNQIVAMVGDGINDAPALAVADVGISVVSATDISIQVSDLLLTSDRLSLIPELVALSKKGQRIIHQNLFWAFFYNIIGIILAIFGILTPIFASFAMVISSLIVLFNSKRLQQE